MRRLITLIVIVTGLIGLIALLTDVRAVLTYLKLYRLPFFGLALVLTTINYVFRFWRWSLYLTICRVQIPVLDSARIFVAGFVMSISPGKMGEVLKSILLNEQHHVPVEQTAPIVIAERLTDFIALVILVAASSYVFQDGYIIAIGGGLFCAVVLAVLSSPRLANHMIRSIVRFPKLKRFKPQLITAYESTRHLLTPRTIVWSTFIACLGWTLECVALWTIVHGFIGASISPKAAIFTYSAPTIIGALTMIPGGLLTTEASMASMLVHTGTHIDTNIATATTLLVRLATLWWGVGLGWASLMWHRRLMYKSVSKGCTR